MVKGSVNPKDPLSKEHWLDSFGVATSVLGVKGVSSTKPNGVTSGKTNSSSSSSNSSKVSTIKVEFHERFSESHIIKGDGVKKNGVSGAHNINHFYDTLKKTGVNIDDLIVGEPLKHPQLPGLYEINYRVPSMKYGPEGNLVPSGQFRNIKDPKTVYDPSIYSDEQIIQFGKKAMQEAIDSNRIVGRQVVGYAPNGMRFTGFIDDGKITNFFPSFD